MANQIVVSAGAKVRNLDGVLTATSGVVSSVPLGAANGVATLDSGGKVPVSQLPSSVVTYLGTWNAATNTPTLVNGIGDAGDMYLCNVAGTVNFGAGPVTFAVGDWVLYGSGTWQKSNGQNGTVTSVGLSTNGGAITIGNSPITTSGVISANFNGTNLQYVNGAGNLTTFPTLITSIGLSMPSAFSVSNSPLTANGTIAVTGAGTTAQYIRGDGSLATFPTIATEAQRLITEVYNETGATLSKGTVVYINGGHGNLPTITKALATGDATSAQTYGIVQTDITNMNNGYVVVIGSLTDLDTSAYVEGTQLYLSSTTAGAWTSVKQYAPAHLVYVAIVTRSHPTQGVVEVMIQNGFEMDELHNVSAQSPLNNQGLFYNTSTSLWENKSIATALGYTPADDSLVVHLAGTETITGVKNFNIGLTLQTGYYPTPALGYVGLGSNGSGITILTKPVSTVYNNNLQFSAASNTYNFPNATGTLALTSDLASYVTLATTQTITGAKTFSGYTTFTSTVDITSGLTFSNSGFTLVLQPPTLSVNRTVTFADITGTIAMLEGTQTFTGAKTFDAAYFNGAEFINTAYFDKGLWLVKNGIPSVFTALQTTIYSESTSNNVIFRDNVSKAKLVFDNSTQTYTFPAASGTIALVGGSGVGTVTSVAALTIGTSGTDLSSSVANSTTTPVITLNVPTASATNRGVLSSSDWTTFNNKYNLPSLTSGSVLFSNGSTIAQDNANFFWDDTNNRLGIGTATPTQKLEVSGADVKILINSTDYAALQLKAGTTRTFNLQSINDGTGSFRIYDATADVERFRIWGSTGNVNIGTTPASDSGYKLDVNGTGRFSSTVNIIAASNAQNLVIQGRSSDNYGQILFYSNNGATRYGYLQSGSPYGGTVALVGDGGARIDLDSRGITGTGAATFSSSVTAGGDINANTSSAALKVYGYQVGKYSYFGYSSGYPGVIIGSSGFQSLFFNVDVSGNPSGSFSGNGSEYVWRNSGTFLTPNSTNNGYNKLFDWNTGGQMTIYNAATFSSSVTASYYDGAIFRVLTSSTFRGGVGTGSWAFADGSNDMALTSDAATKIGAGGTERMRITSGGALCLGVTSAYGTNLLNVNGGIYATSSIAAVVAADLDMLVFQNTGATYSKACVVASMAATGGTGSYFFYGQQSTSTAAIKIFSNGNIQNTNNSYGAISDARLKENIKDATPKLDDLMKVKVRNYNLKGESNKQLGVISQELEAIFPNMIEESTNMGENMKIKGVKYSVFVPMLIKAVQEQQQQINELKQLLNK